MLRRTLPGIAAVALLASALAAATPATAKGPSKPSSSGTVKVGYGEADATWHVGAGAGQYSDKSDPLNLATGEGGVDPHGHSATQADSYGVHSRLSYRAIVVQDAEGDHTAFVKSDSYLAQDHLTRRVGQILAEKGSGVGYDEIMLMASHNHSSPYYTTPSWGVWLFQDAFDLRAFEYHARQMAQSILDAEASMVDAKMGATMVEHQIFKGMIQRARLADDDTPVGYPRDFGDLGLTVIRFDSLGAPGKPSRPIATMINWGQHPEGLDNHDLITGDFVAPLERFVERFTGAPLVFGQGDVGSAEAGPGRPDLVPAGVPKRWSHVGHAQTERGAWLLAQDVVKGWERAATPEAIVAFDSEFDVEAGNVFVPGPVSHPYPSISNCRTHTTAEGNPGMPVAGLPDCARAQNGNDNGNPLNPLFENLKAHGIPVPEHYDAPGFTGVEENLRIKLQAFKLGEVLLASCGCEAQVDLILNLESRLDDKTGNIWDGYDWRNKLGCAQNADSTWTCDHPRDSGKVTFSNAAYDRMVAQIHNDANGWNDPQNAVAANAESADPAKIWGNFTKEELPAELGYALPVGVGHASDYNGYTVSYREYMTYDDYRKALTSYGPHTADYMNTWLVRLAASLNGGPDLPDAPNQAMADADEARQLAVSTALGKASSAAWDAWQAALPNDFGPAAPLTQPTDIRRFEATTFSWRGGSNAVDNPVVTVERKHGQGWEVFADQSGEVQTMVEFPDGPDGVVETYAGQREWVWTANFEAFHSFPVEIGSTPGGEYRFVVEGNIREGGVTKPYRVESASFKVRGWEGIEVSELTRTATGVTFKLPQAYPQTYESPFRYIAVEMKEDEVGVPFCTRCSFRPWATTIDYMTVLVTVQRSDGTVEKVPATFVPAAGGTPAHWFASVSLTEGDSAYVAKGDVIDAYGESNEADSNVI